MNVSRRISRWKEIYKPDPPRTLVRYIISYPGPDSQKPMLSAANKTARLDWSKRMYEWQLRNYEGYLDDSIPCIYVVTGTEIFAECFGCMVVYPNDNMPFALPFIHDSHSAAKLETPKLEDTPLMLLFDMADELRRYAGDEVIMRLPDIQCPIDVTALIWDKNDLFISLLEEPEAVKEVAEKVKTLQISFIDEWFKRYGTNYIAHYPDYYMEGGITMSVDEIGSVSPQMFDEFFKDEINSLSKRYGGVGIHSCADSFKHWEKLKKIQGLKLINFNRNEMEITQAYEYFKDDCVQMHFKSNWSDSAASRLGINVFPEKSRVVLPLWAEDFDHARKLADKCAAVFV